MVFLIFGTSKGVVLSWGNMLVLLFTCGKKRLHSSTSDGVTSSSGLRKVVGMAVSTSGADMTKSVSDDDGDGDTDSNQRNRSEDTDSSDSHQRGVESSSEDEGTEMAELAEN